ncbi:MAG: MFS transporter [Rhizobiales bacterium]|nr:MFS transporter [Hyphomicrobiales bacterium]
MGRVLNLMAFVVFATTLFMRSVDPVIPQIAAGLDVTPTTAALLSTGFTLPYALVQPVLGALADMFSKARLIAISMLICGLATLACGLVTNFETLMGLRVLAGITAGGIFPIALAVVGDRVSVGERQVAIGKLLFAAMTGNLLGASGAGVIGDLLGWRGVFLVTAAIELVALAVAIPGFRGMKERAGRFDLTTLVPNYRAILRNPMAKFCFGTVFVEAVCMYGVFPYMAGLLLTEGETRASIAGIVLAGFGVGGVIYTLMVGRLLSFIGERRLMASGGMVMAFCLIVIALRAPWPVEFANFILLGFGFYLLHGCVQVYVTELAPAARGSAAAAHSCFFFLGQAVGPVVYGLGIGSVGITAVLLAGSLLLAAVGWMCASRLRRTAAASS